MPMSYGNEYKPRTIGYLREGHRLEQTYRVFKVSISTIRYWENQYDSAEGFAKKPLNRKLKKIDQKKLQAYVAEHPDA